MKKPVCDDIAAFFMIFACIILTDMPAARGHDSLDARFPQIRDSRLWQASVLLVTTAMQKKGDSGSGCVSTIADAVANDLERWDLVLERLEQKAMPPAKARIQPNDAERRNVIEWIQAIRKHEATRHAGDPGPISARRLSNAEYDHTIRDLTGVDLRPTREFPVDPANRAGFDNSSESLTMSPALLKKYLEAAQFVADHLVLAHNGLEFAEYPVCTDTDRDTYCTRTIIDFYKRQRTDYADFFLAAWRFKHRVGRGAP